jgi:hypothetical protein
VLKFIAFLAYIIIDSFKPTDKQDEELKKLFK